MLKKRVRVEAEIAYGINPLVGLISNIVTLVKSSQIILLLRPPLPVSAEPICILR